MGDRVAARIIISQPEQDWAAVLTLTDDGLVELPEHDCHNDPDDGCSVCGSYDG